MNQILEKQQDRDNEHSICLEIKKYLSNNIKITPSLPYHYIIDRALLLNDIVKAWVEIKCINYDLVTLPVYYISLHKIKVGVDWSEMTNTPFFIIVKFKDGIKYTEINKKCLDEYSITWGGWKNPRRGNDKELLLNIPVDRLYRLDMLKERIR